MRRSPHTTNHRFRIGVLLALALAAHPATARAQAFGQEGDPGDARGGTGLASAGDLAEVVAGLDGFDPVKDVPFMRNWSSESYPGGNGGNCYAMLTTTILFAHRVRWAPEEEGLPLDEWAAARREGRAAALRVDADALDALPTLLAMDREIFATERLVLAGYDGLRDFTRPENEATETRYRQWVEAIQNTIQKRASNGSLLVSKFKSGLGFLPGPFGSDAVNEDGVNILRDRLPEGFLSPLAMMSIGGFTGHVLLPYAFTETERTFTVLAYDVNDPPEETRARPARVTFYKEEGYRYEVKRFDGGRRYADYGLAVIQDVEGGWHRRKFRNIAGNWEEHLQRNRHAGKIRNGSLGEKLEGLVGLTGEFLNPF